MTDAKWYGISFPAIVDGVGADQVMAEAADMGLTDHLLCAIIYSGYRLVMPRHPCQVYQLEEGVAFYPCAESYAGTDMRPLATRDFADDVFAAAAEAAARRGVRLHAWLCCFANRRLATTYPSNAAQNLYGSRDRMFLCFNNPNVTGFCVAMARELMGRYPLAGIMADKIPQAQMEATTLAGHVDPLLRLCASICFCEHCLNQAKRDGLDLGEARRRALEIADASRKVGQHVRSALADDLRGDTEVPLFLLEEPLFAQVLRWRMHCVSRFLSELREEIRSVRPEAQLGACLVPPVKVGHDFTVPRAFLSAESYRIFAPSVDALHAVIHWEPWAIEYDTRRARDQVDASGAACELCVHTPAYGRFAPEQVGSMVAAARRQGADSIAFFCHDFLDERMIEAVRQAVHCTKSAS